MSQLQYLQSFCTTESSVQHDHAKLILIRENERLDPADFEFLRNTVYKVQLARETIYFFTKATVEFAFLTGTVFLGSKDEDKEKGLTSFQSKDFKHLDHVILPENAFAIHLGWKDVMDALLLGCIDNASNESVKAKIEMKYKSFLSCMKELEKEDKSKLYKMFGIRAYTPKICHTTCEDYFNKCEQEIFLHLRERLDPKITKTCLYNSRPVVEEQDVEKIPFGVFSKPLQFVDKFRKQLTGFPFTYDYTQLGRVGDVSDKYKESVRKPSFLQLYNKETESFAVKKVVYCRVSPRGIFINNELSMRLMMNMIEMLYDYEWKAPQVNFDVGIDVKPLEEYDINDPDLFKEPESKMPKYDFE